MKQLQHLMRTPAFWRALFVLAALAILVLSLMPPSSRLPSTGWDKSNHALGFAVLAFLALQAFAGRLLAVAAGLLAYGALIEVLQSLTPYRLAEWGDLWADGIGVLLGALAQATWAWRLRRREVDA